MTKSKSQVNDEKPEVDEDLKPASTDETETPTIDQLLGGDEEPDAPLPETTETVVEETPVPAETAAPLMNHGTHNAAVNGLQTSPGYDPSKL